MSGRRPKPRAVRELEGNRGHRPLPDEPLLETTGATTCPAYLSRAAKLEWRRLYDDLATSGIVKRTDRQILALYCEACADFREACLAIQDHLKRHGSLYYRTKAGVLKPIPQLATKRQAAEDIRRHGVEIGLTPSARTRVGAGESGNANDPLADFMAGGGPIAVDPSAN